MYLIFISNWTTPDNSPGRLFHLKKKFCPWYIAHLNSRTTVLLDQWFGVKTLMLSNFNSFMLLKVLHIVGWSSSAPCLDYVVRPGTIGSSWLTSLLALFPCILKQLNSCKLLVTKPGALTWAKMDKVYAVFGRLDTLEHDCCSFFFFFGLVNEIFTVVQMKFKYLNQVKASNSNFYFLICSQTTATGEPFLSGIS